MPKGIYPRKRGYKRPPFSIKWKQRMSDARKGYKYTKKTKKKISKALKGVKRKPLSKKWKDNISKALKKLPSNAKGKHWKLSKKTKQKIRNANKGKKSHLWKDGRYSNKKYVSWIKNRRNRILKKGIVGSHTFEEWEKLKKKYDYTCPCCKEKEPFKNQKTKTLTEDHIIPLSKGGSENIENIQPLCRKCNNKKYTKIIKY